MEQVTRKLIHWVWKS